LWDGEYVDDDVPRMEYDPAEAMLEMVTNHVGYSRKMTQPVLH